MVEVKIMTLNSCDLLHYNAFIGMIWAQHGNVKVSRSIYFPIYGLTTASKEICSFLCSAGVNPGPHVHLFNTALSYMPSSAVSFSFHPDQ